MKTTLHQHFMNVVKDIQTIDQYFVQSDILKCVDYVQCTNRGCPLTSKQMNEYRLTKLALHQLAILKDVSNIDVLEDEVSDVDVFNSVSSAYNQELSAYRTYFQGSN